MKHILIFYCKNKETWSIEIALPDREYEDVMQFGASGFSGKTMLMLPPPSTWIGISTPEGECQ